MKDIMRAQEEAGVDIIELGIPFSDPVADGPVIQEASYRSILKGTNLNSVFQAVGEAREEGLGVPIVFMMYYNTVLHYGLEKFAGRCAQIGVDGLIIPDLPYEEQEPLKSALMKVEGAPVIIQLVSPLSRQRIPMILEEARGFVYCVSSMGVTGQEAAFYSEVAAYLKRSETRIRDSGDDGIRDSGSIRCEDGCGHDRRGNRRFAFYQASGRESIRYGHGENIYSYL